MKETTNMTAACKGMNTRRNIEIECQESEYLSNANNVPDFESPVGAHVSLPETP